MIEQAEKVWPVAVVCRTVGSPRSSYYAWKARQAKPDTGDQALVEKVKEIHRDCEQNYGSRRMSDALKKIGHMVGRHRARTLMARAQVQVYRKRRHYYSKGGKPSAIAPNLLDRKFTVEQPDTVWAGDITFVWTQQGWLYLAVVLDLFSRRVVGWAFSGCADTSLVTQALDVALGSRRPSKGLLFHSDQGSQYTSHAFQAKLHHEGITASMSRVGNCWDNAVVERFFCTLKGERIRGRAYLCHREAQVHITDYMLFFYNQRRLHSAMQNMSPADYETLKRKEA